MEASIVYFSSLFFSIIFLYLFIRNSTLQNIDPIFLFTFSLGLTSFANIVGVSSFGGENEFVYNLYTYIPTLFDASIVHYIGFILLVGGYEFGNNKNWLPSLSYKITDENKNKYLFIFILFVIYISIQGRIPGFLGAIRAFIIGLPLFVAFYLVKRGIKRKKPIYLIYAGVIVIILTIQAVLFSFLRTNMIKPAVFFILAYIIAHGNVRVLFRLKLIPVYIFVALFASYFGIFGSERTKIGVGTQRIENLVELKEDENIVGQTPLSRLTNFNQLSQVVQLTIEDGFLEGETLQYLGIVFIPRFIWPGKPLIQMGAWFAERIGLGWIDYEGKYHNSINMTIPGELYLNFGYIGVIIGSFLIGFIFRLFWNSVNSWKNPEDLFGNIFAAYLLFLGLFSLGADIQILITILATYLIMLFLNRFLLKNV
jgi:hypothetical protein